MMYPPNARADDAGVGEAYPSSMPSSTGDPSEAAAYQSGDPFYNDAMHPHDRPLDQSNFSSGDGTSRWDGGGGDHRASYSSSSFRHPPSSGARSFSAVDDAEEGDDAYERGGRGRRNRPYEEAQLRSSFRQGGLMYNEGGGGGSHYSGRSSFQQQQQPYSVTSWSQGGGGGGGSESGGHRSSFRSGAPGEPPAPAGGSVLSNPHNPRQHRPPPVGISLSGNLLVRVEIEEDDDLELDKDEIRELANATRAREDAASSSEALNLRSLNNDASTIGTTRTTRSRLSEFSKSAAVVEGSPDDTIVFDDDGGRGGPRSDVDKGREKMREIIFSPPFRRTLFLGICSVLLGLGVLLTLENFVSVKTAADWLEPHKDKYLMERGGGIDWAFGDDSPRPLAGASVDDAFMSHLADWHRDTSRVPPEVGMDGFGSVAVSEAAMFNDVPLLWGLPFAGGSTMENILGQCLHLVQASDKGVAGVDNGGGVGDELRLRTVSVVGKTYLNVDLSTQEGIERASALALGTSGMADVAHSPLLHEASELFSPANRGRLFVLVRHPVERELARIRHVQRWREGMLLGGKGEERDEGMTYEQYARSDVVADNWMTRMLVQKREDEELNAKDMHTAKEILRRKALIGLYSDIMGASRHYARHFGWDHSRKGGRLSQPTLSCFESAILDGMKKDMEEVGDLVKKDSREGSAAWRKILDMNKFDLELFAYSQQLYKYQISLS